MLPGATAAVHARQPTEIPTRFNPALKSPAITGHLLVAYIPAAIRKDTDGPLDAPNSHNDGKYAMYVTVSQPNHGPTFNIKPGEDLDPVKTLRMRYDAWIKAHPEFKR